MIARITRAYVRHYADNGQTTCYVEWRDVKGRNGRTEGNGVHMAALLARAEREGVTVDCERWTA